MSSLLWETASGTAAKLRQSPVGKSQPPRTRPQSPRVAPFLADRDAKVRFRRTLIAPIRSTVHLIYQAWLQRRMVYLPIKGPVPLDYSNLPPGQIHEVSIQTHDRLALKGWWALPDQLSTDSLKQLPSLLADGDHPVVLYFPGTAGNRRVRTSEVELLTQLGCHVLLVDYRGYADNPGKPSEHNLREDAWSIWAYLTRDLDIPPNRILIFGESLGGGVATALTAELCQSGFPPAGLILRATFTSLVDVAHYRHPWALMHWVLLDRYNSLRRIPAVTCPLLHFHGTADTLIPYRMGRRLFEAAPECSDSGVPKRFVTLERAGHDDIMYIAADTLREEIGEFLDRVDLPVSSASTRWR